MSFFSESVQNVVAWWNGKMDFTTLKATEVADLRKVTNSLPDVAQAGVHAMIDRIEVNASAMGQIAGNALAPFLAQSADAQATQIMNMLSAVGVNPVAGTPLSALEHAALQAAVTGLHTTLDRVAVAIAHMGVPAPAAQPVAQPAAAVEVHTE